MSESERSERYEALRPLDILALMERWRGQGDYCARDVLVERGVFDDPRSAGLSDYGHWLAKVHFGAIRIHPPLPPGLGWRKTGVMLGIGRHLDVRVHRMTSETALGSYRLTKKPDQSFSGILAVLLGPAYEMREAWVVPGSVIRRLEDRRKWPVRYSEPARHSKMPVRGDWQADPEVECLYGRGGG